VFSGPDPAPFATYFLAQLFEVVKKPLMKGGKMKKELSFGRSLSKDRPYAKKAVRSPTH